MRHMGETDDASERQITPHIFSMQRMIIYAVKAKNVYRFGYRFGKKRIFEIRNVDCDTGLFRVISVER